MAWAAVEGEDGGGGQRRHAVWAVTAQGMCRIASGERMSGLDHRIFGSVKHRGACQAPTTIHRSPRERTQSRAARTVMKPVKATHSQTSPVAPVTPDRATPSTIGT